MSDADKAHAEAVEAVARAICDDEYLLDYSPPFDQLLPEWQEVRKGSAQRIITSYLAAMERSGWVVVPVEATKEQYQAGIADNGPSGIYRAMVAARPKVAPDV